MPRGVGVLLIVASVALLVVEPIVGMLSGPDALWVVGPVLLGASLAWMGYALSTGTPAYIGSRLIQPARFHSSSA